MDLGLRMLGEGLQHILDEVLDGLEGRVEEHLAVVVHLQRHQIPAPVHRRAAQALLQTTLAEPEELLAPAGTHPAQALGDRVDRPVVTVMAEDGPGQCARDAVGHGRPGNAAEGLPRRHGKLVGPDPRVPQVDGRIARKRGIGVHAIALQRHVVRPQIAFLEDVEGAAQGLGDPARGLVHRPHLAEHDQGLDALVAHQPLQPQRPALVGAGEVQRTRLAVEQRIAAVEMHLVHPLAMGHQASGQLVEEAPHRPLQQQHALVSQQAMHRQWQRRPLGTTGQWAGPVHAGPRRVQAGSSGR